MFINQNLISVCLNVFKLVETSERTVFLCICVEVLDYSNDPVQYFVQYPCLEFDYEYSTLFQDESEL